MKLLTCLLFAILILVGPVFSADVYNVGTLTKSETATQVTYRWDLTVPALGDSAGSWHSPPMLIADCNSADGYTYAVGTAGAGTEDVNLIYHLSLDNARNYWTTVTPADYDALGGTAVVDTIGYEEAADSAIFSVAQWLVVEYDGQASNESNRAFVFVVALTKDLTLTDNAANYTRLARIATGNGTNP